MVNAAEYPFASFSEDNDFVHKNASMSSNTEAVETELLLLRNIAIRKIF